MEHSSSWEANRFSANQEIPRIVWNPNVHYRIHKRPPPVRILRHLDPYQSIILGPRLSMPAFRNIIRFDGEKLLAPRSTPKLEDHHLSAVRDWLFNIFAAYWRSFLHPQPEDAPCRRDMDPLITITFALLLFIIFVHSHSLLHWMKESLVIYIWAQDSVLGVQNHSGAGRFGVRIP